MLQECQITAGHHGSQHGSPEIENETADDKIYDGATNWTSSENIGYVTPTIERSGESWGRSMSNDGR